MKFNDPRLMLFAFHLRNNFDREKPVEDAKFLWQQCQQLGDYLKIPRLQSLGDRLEIAIGEIGINPGTSQSDYLELLQPERFLKFSAIPSGSSRQLRGTVYPLQIHDSYAVDITLRFPELHIELEQLQYLNPQGCLQFDRSFSSLGRTLIFFAQPDDKVEDFEALSEDCITSILPESDRNFYELSSHGKFLGSPIFEYQPIETESAGFNSIFIWFNCTTETEALEEEGEYYQPLIYYLCCRSKIDYAYAQSRQCDKDSRSLYREFADKLKELHQLPDDRQQRLGQLKTLLSNLPQTSLEYADFLQDLELHRVAIQTNYTNINSTLEDLQKISLPQDDIDFLKTTNSAPQFIAQIQTDLAYLQPNRGLFQQAIDTIRGTVEIDRTELDRASIEAGEKRQQRLELFITVVSTGLAVSGISSQVAHEPTLNVLTQLVPDRLCPNFQPESSNYLCSIVLPISAHLLLGILVAIPFGALVWMLQTNPFGKLIQFVKKR
ncbi:MAG: hypothetical protein SWY16_22450 [Cyanobacteriota bacterium]|nr:hypothetical protein [Cyanobacteriota bacterium]